MFYELAQHYIDSFGALNVFKYITFRSGSALFTAFMISFLIGPYIINWLNIKQTNGQPIRKDGPESHLLTKVGTPTMGGLIILISMITSSVLWCNLANNFVWITLFSTIGFGIIGGYDDYIKLSKNSSDGISAKLKFTLQVIISTLTIMAINYSIEDKSYANTLAIPFLKDVLLPLGVFYIPFGVAVITGASNAVNLTDGLDGLAIVPIMIASACFAIIAYLVGNSIFSHYLQITHVPGTGEIAVICGAIIGAGLGFLWYNAPPAKIFMGDIGALSMGATLGTISIITKHEIVLAIIGGVFVIETVSVIIQVLYFRFTGGKRLFLMAPIHHHYEKKGWSESTIVIRFWIISILFALLGLATLKLR